MGAALDLRLLRGDRPRQIQQGFQLPFRLIHDGRHGLLADGQLIRHQLAISRLHLRLFVTREPGSQPSQESERRENDDQIGRE